MEYSEFKDMFDRAFEERINQSILTIDEDVADEIGLDGVSCYFQEIANLLSLLNIELSEVDYKLNLSSSYVVLASMIEHATALELIDGEDDWDDIAAYFYRRGEEFAGQGPTDDLKVVTEDQLKWTNVIDVLNRTVLLNSRVMSEDEFTIDEKILLVRMLVLMLRNRRVIDYKHQWVKALLVSLDEDWRIHGGGFGGGMGGGSNPWSSPRG